MRRTVTQVDSRHSEEVIKWKEYGRECITTKNQSKKKTLSQTHSRLPDQPRRAILEPQLVHVAENGGAVSCQSQTRDWEAGRSVQSKRAGEVVPKTLQ